MRLVPEIFEKVQSGQLYGVSGAPNARITVEPAWQLRKTNTVYGNSVRGPYRYYTDADYRLRTYEVPSVKSITWNRSKGQDLATCTITIYNAWHEGNTQDPELVSQLGKPGFFWPKRGEGDAGPTWNQSPGQGAYKYDGTWDPNFSWQDVLVEDALIRCVDVDTEILTKRGWLTYDQVTEGDFALGINPETGMSEWQEIKEVFRKKIDQEVTHLKTRVHDSLTTDNHRWLVKNRNNDFVWKTTETLNNDSKVPLAVPFSGNAEKIYSDELVELAAWYYTEGSYDRRSGSYVNIRQSRKANPEYCDRIINLLTSMFGPSGNLPRGKRLNVDMAKLALKMLDVGDPIKEISEVTGISGTTIYRWKTGERTPNLENALWTVKEYDDCLTFIISAAATDDLLNLIQGSDKVPSLEFIHSLTSDQLNLFVDVCIMADGTEDEYQRSFIQSNKERIKAFEMICVLAGIPFHTMPKKDTNCVQISLLRQHYVKPISALSQKGENPKRIHYKDTIWCPRVEHGNWFARRNGCGYFTGNTYEGYGNKPNDLQYVSVFENEWNQDVVVTGVWIVDSVTASSDGLLTLQCKDIGRILLDQIVFPPIIPDGLYPLEYYPEGKSAFDSMWGGRGKHTLARAEKGRVKTRPHSSSGSSDSTRAGHTLEKSVDGSNETYALSEAYPLPNEGDSVYFDYLVGPDSAYQLINEVQLWPWAGGYTCYISVMDNNGNWYAGDEGLGGVIPATGGMDINYVAKIAIPTHAPEGIEPHLNVRLRSHQDERSNDAHFLAQRVRLTFQNLYYSGVPNSSGHQYRAGLRELVVYRSGAPSRPFQPINPRTPMSFAMCAHPTRGYWVVDNGGTIHGFGDAADFDSDSGFADITMETNHSNSALMYNATAISATSDGKGLFVLDESGTVHLRGTADRGSHGANAAFYGGSNAHPDISNSWYHRRLSTNTSAAMPEVMNWSTDIRVPPVFHAVDLAVTHTGDGYWVLYSDGLVLGFGDATPKITRMQKNTPTQTFMANWFNGKDGTTFNRWMNARTGCAIISDPNAMGFMVTNASGEVWKSTNGGSLIRQTNGELKNRIYNKGTATEFKLDPYEWPTAMERTVSGDGYWILFPTGRIAAFGDAADQGPVDMYAGFRKPEYNAIASERLDPEIFKILIWSIARDSDGNGFYTLAANGAVGYFNAEFWGQPSSTGLSGFRWHEGNYCVDDTTEVFTNRGWLECYDLREDDKILGINPETSKSEWQDISNIFIKKTKVKMYETKCRGFDALTTQNHRWLVKKATVPGWRWTTSEELNTNDRIPLRSDADDSVFPSEKKYSDDFVLLAAYYWTEGCLDDSGRGKPRLSMSQDRQVNPENWDKIHQSFTNLFGEPGNMREGFKWNMHTVNSGTTSFRVSNQFTHLFTDVIEGKNKIINPQFILSLTKDQIKMFVEESIKADGHVKKKGCIVISQSNPDRLKSFEPACILAGYGVSSNNDTLTLIQLETKSPLSNVGKPGRHGVHDIVEYDGVIWCPTTTHGNWLARRNGKVYYTGNTDYSDIVKDLLTWSGFTFYDPSLTGKPSVLGMIESTGIPPETHFGPDKFDKKTIMECVREIGEVAAYDMGVTEEGGFYFRCVDPETEILSKHLGWISYDQLNIGDEVLSLNKETNQSEWVKVENINIYPVENVDMVYIDRDFHRSLSTPNHRWWVENVRKTNPRHEPKWIESSELNSEHAIKVTAPYSEFPDRSIFDDDFIELVGWWMTEGHFAGLNGTLTQSHSVYPENCGRIYSALVSVYGMPGEQIGNKVDNNVKAWCQRLRKSGKSFKEISELTGHDRHSVSIWCDSLIEEQEFGLWNFHINDKYLEKDYNTKSGAKPATIYRLGKKITQDLQLVAPNRVPTMEFLLSLTESQMKILYEVCLLGDGSISGEYQGKKYNNYHQQFISCAKSFEIICQLLGKGFHTKPESNKNAFKTRVLEAERFKPVTENTKPELINYTGNVWCPTLAKNEVWLARRDGTSFYTGNSPHWWSSGNWDQAGQKILVEENTFDRTFEEDGVEFIPTIHESADLLNYSASLSSTDKRSELIIGTTQPSPKDPGRTGFIRHVPATATEVLANGAPSLRGIERPGIWVSQMFENENERRLMAELIGIHAWFARRTGSTTCVANPCLSIGDQVRLIERNTSETNIHLITAIDSSIDLDTGVYTMSLTTHWLGDGDQWAMSADPSSESPIVISERLDSWQSYSNRGLGTGNVAKSPSSVMFGNGKFASSVYELGGNWAFGADITLSGRIDNLFVRTNKISNTINRTGKLGDGTADISTFVGVYDSNGSILMYGALAPLNDTLALGPMGVNGATTTYKIAVLGATVSVGVGELGFTLSSSSSNSLPFNGSVIVVPRESEDEYVEPTEPDLEDE